MNKVSRCFRIAASIAAFSVATSVNAQFEDEYNPTQDEYTYSYPRGSVQNVNKASSLVGMRVQNNRNQDLGRIEDVVIDLDTGRVSYVVLATDRGYGREDKLVAVPITSFSPAPNRRGLVLNVERERLDRVRGFTRSNWPSVSNPRTSAFLILPERSTYQAQRNRFERDDYEDYIYSDPRSRRRYEDTEMTGRGSWMGTGDVRTGRFDDRFEQERFERLDEAMENERDQEFYSRYGRDRTSDDYYAERQYQPRSSATARQNRQVFSGEVTAIDPESRTMTVESDTRTVTFKFDERPVITLKNMRNPSIADIRVGYDVRVGYFQDEYGANVAKTIIRSTTPEVR